MEDIIGHDKQASYFKTILKADMFRHAYLFAGPQMIGKRSFALQLYKKINDLKENNGFNENLLEIAGYNQNKSSIGIETVRSIKKFLSLKPNSNLKKFVIIDDAHQFTDESANALLKILEEPPSYGIIILVSHLPGMLTDTIKSRCEEVRFSVLPDELMEKLDFVKNLSGKNKEFVLKLSSGRPGCAHSLTVGGQIKEAENSIEDLRKLLKGGVVERFKYSQKLAESENINQTVQWWLDWVAASLKSSHKNALILKHLLILNDLTNQPQYNSRLALENFFLRI